ncbi:MAG: hypothetical protein QNI90_05075 [Dinoroseobacter sp.]|nr:hypothetical protein [Dinoroseobacter sp.]
MKFLSAGLPAIVTLAATLPTAVPAEEWEFEGSLYLFAAETTLGKGDLEGTLSFSDALENLDFAAMAAFAASNGQWTFIADVMHFDLSFENDTDGVLFTGLDTDSVTTLFNGLALYRVQETPRYSLDLGGGFRYFKTDTTLALRPGLLPGRSVRNDDSWTDPVLAAIGRFELSEKWTSTIAADYGSFVSDRETYQLTVSLGYRFAENWTARLGYRYVNVENDEDDFRFEQSGPLLGVNYRF